MNSVPVPRTIESNIAVEFPNGDYLTHEELSKARAGMVEACQLEASGLRQKIAAKERTTRTLNDALWLANERLKAAGLK